MPTFDLPINNSVCHFFHIFPTICLFFLFQTNDNHPRGDSQVAVPQDSILAPVNGNANLTCQLIIQFAIFLHRFPINCHFLFQTNGNNNNYPRGDSQVAVAQDSTHGNANLTC